MMLATATKYKYNTNVKLSQIHGSSPAHTVFPNIEDMVMSSRNFDDFQEAVDSANAFVAELATVINGPNQDKFKMLSEVNPKFTGKETISKDWGPDEVAKLWIIDSARQDRANGPMLAIALTQLLEIQDDHVLVN